MNEHKSMEQVIEEEIKGHIPFRGIPIGQVWKIARALKEAGYIHQSNLDPIYEVLNLETLSDRAKVSFAKGWIDAYLGRIK